MASHVYWNMPIIIDDQEVLADVHYFYQPAELDVGISRPGIELEKVMVDGEEKLFDLTDNEVEQISLTLSEMVGPYNERF